MGRNMSLTLRHEMDQTKRLQDYRGLWNGFIKCMGPQTMLSTKTQSNKALSQSDFVRVKRDTGNVEANETPFLQFFAKSATVDSKLISMSSEMQKKSLYGSEQDR